MMQKVIGSTRERLTPFLKNAGLETPEVPKASVSHIEMGPDRLVKKIPARNYKNLARLVPIKWL